MRPKQMVTLVGLTLVSAFAFAGVPGEVYDRDDSLGADDFQFAQSYYEKNPFTDELTAMIGDGTNALIVTYERSTDRVYISTPYAMADFPLMNVALDYANGNMSIASSLVSQIRNSALNNLGYEDSGYSMGFNSWEPPSGVPGPCDLSPCRDYVPLPGNIYEDFLGGRTVDEMVNEWWVGYYTEEYIAEDKEDFERWRENECDKDTDDALGIVVGIVGAIGTCPFYDTTPGWTGCSVAAATLLKAMSSDANKNCHSKYSGPGWGS